MSVSTENFIKNIYLLEKAPRQQPSSSRLSARLNISRAAVTDMLRKLKDRGLVCYERYGIPSLTAKGEKMALSIIRRHRLWETFLHRNLKVPWEYIHREAEILEHNSSEYLTDKLDEFMKHPSFDPHGDPIPDKNGKLPKMPEHIILSEVTNSGRYRVTRVMDQDNDLVELLNHHNIFPGTTVQINNDFDANSPTIYFKKNKIQLTKEMAAKLFLEAKKPVAK